MNKLGIFLPTYKRPDSIKRVAKNIEETTTAPFTLYFGIEPKDKASIESATETGHKVIINSGKLGYADTIQTIYDNSDEPFFMHANDDFEFLQGWDESPLSMFEREDLMVAGLRQHESDNHGSAICMVRRKYIKDVGGVVDMGPGRVFYPYNHNYIDTEFTQTAQKRGVWAKCDALGINHLHPGFTGKEKDYTYRKNDETVSKDEQTFESRRHLWA